MNALALILMATMLLALYMTPTTANDDVEPSN